MMRLAAGFFGGLLLLSGYSPLFGQEGVDLPGEDRRLRGCGFCKGGVECDGEHCEVPPDKLGPGNTIPVARLRAGKR